MSEPVEAQLLLNDPTDREAVDDLENAATLLVTAAKRVTIVDASNIDDASAMLVDCVTYHKRAEALRVKLTKPLLDHKRWIDALFKRKTQPVVELEESLREGISAYETARERERREAEAKMRRELQAKAEVDRERKAKMLGHDVDDIDVPDYSQAEVMPKLVTDVKTSGGKVTTRPVPDVRVVDPDMVPREFCVVDKKRVRKFVDSILKTHSWEEAREVFEHKLPGVKVDVKMTTVVNAGQAQDDFDL